MKRPSFQWYPKDYLTDLSIEVMTLEEEGAYRRLMDYEWLHQGLPNDTAALAKMCRITEARFKKLWPAMEPCFKPNRSGWHNRAEWWALVPMIPPLGVRLAGGGSHLREHFILWEVDDWSTSRPQSLPPYDPYLLRPLGGDLYAVVHEWDLTEIERRRDGREGDRVTESPTRPPGRHAVRSHEGVSRKLPRSNGGDIARNAWPMDTSRHHMVTV